MKLINAWAAGAIALLAACGAPTVPEGVAPGEAPRFGYENREGRENHRAMVRHFGGEVASPELRAYVERIGRRIVAETPQAEERWTFTVLDNAELRAFAGIGGYLYITRGFLALADTEAEVAAVMGHEAAHITSGHSLRRRQKQRELDGSDDAVKRQLAGFSRKNETEADTLGFGYLVAAGYDPAGLRDLHQASLDWRLHQAARLKFDFDPSRQRANATHPALARRVKAAEAARARTPAAPNATVGRDAHLAAIDGMAFGPAADEAQFRGLVYTDPRYGVTFTAAESLPMFVTRNRVAGGGEKTGVVFFDHATDEDVALPDLLRDKIAPAMKVEETDGASVRFDIEETVINDAPAVRARFPTSFRKRATTGVVALYRANGRIFRLAGQIPRDREDLMEELEEAQMSFRRLRPGETRDLPTYRIRIHTVRAGDTIATLAARLPYGADNAGLFRALNGLSPGQRLRAGRRVKLVVR